MRCGGCSASVCPACSLVTCYHARADHCAQQAAALCTAHLSLGVNVGTCVIAAITSRPSAASRGGERTGMKNGQAALLKKPARRQARRRSVGGSSSSSSSSSSSAQVRWVAG